MRSDRPFKVITYTIALHHLILGVFVLFASQTHLISELSSVFGISVSMAPDVFYIAKLCAVYMLIFAMLMFSIAKNPKEYQGLLWLPFSFFGMRILERIMLSDTLTFLQVSKTTQLCELAVLCITALLFYYYRPRN